MTQTIRFTDGSAAYSSSNVAGKFVAHWDDRTPLRGDNDERSYFDSVDEAAAAIQAGGEGKQVKEVATA